MTRKLQTLKGKADYARRKAIVEPVFGQMKVAQEAGQFRLGGTDKTDDEWALHTFCHNLRGHDVLRSVPRHRTVGTG